MSIPVNFIHIKTLTRCWSRTGLMIDLWQITWPSQMTDLICADTPSCPTIIPPIHGCSYSKLSKDLQHKILVYETTDLQDMTETKICAILNQFALWDHIEHHNKTCPIPHKNLWKILSAGTSVFCRTGKNSYWQHRTEVGYALVQKHSCFSQNWQNQFSIHRTSKGTDAYFNGCSAHSSFILKITKTVLSALPLPNCWISSANFQPGLKTITYKWKGPQAGAQRDPPMHTQARAQSCNAAKPTPESLCRQHNKLNAKGDYCQDTDPHCTKACPVCHQMMDTHSNSV